MKIIRKLIWAFCIFSFLLSCSVSGYITDPQSVKRQKEMHSQRTGLNIGEGFLVVGSAIGAAFTGIDFYSPTEGRAYRKMKLLNGSKDTLFVNMVTDWQWKDSTYFDIREIVMPPKKTMKLIVPMGISYNIYFRNNYNAPDDEKVEINTANVSQVKLQPEKERTGAQLSN